MLSITHAQDPHRDIFGLQSDLFAKLRNMDNSLRTTHKWDVRDDRTAEILIKCREDLPLLRPDFPLLPLALLVIAQALMLRFEALGEIADIDDSITYLKEFLTIPLLWQDAPSHDENHHTATASLFTGTLGEALVLRFNHSKNVEDMHAAIDNYRMALALLTSYNPMRRKFLVSLVRALKLRFKDHGRREDIDEAIQWQREVVSLSQIESDEDESLVAMFLSVLGNLLVDRYETSNLIIDVEEATENYEKALVLLPDNSQSRPQYLANLAMSLHLIFKAKGQVEDLNGAIDHLREAISGLLGGDAPLDEGETQVAVLLNVLGSFLVDRYKTFSLIVDLEEAIESYGKALAFLPDNSERRPQYLSQLADSLLIIFEAKDQVEDLNGAIDRVREALVCLSGGDVPHDEGDLLESLAKNLDQLGNLLLLRYQKITQIVDLEEATESYGNALVLLPDNSERRPRCLRALALSLHETGEAKGQVEDLNEAVDRLREALICLSGGDVPHDEGEMYETLRLLGKLLANRFWMTKDSKTDLDEAI
ncbi:hypothetical protein PHLCEN_2v5371 [Hermanssonia centrifuga]|uniref:TPR-like protein n=1 Tax=Hermanssonia centrifuga TaxID=98765 RepID=A0A2R6P5D2_9APHY|nr:hypothetical protein PHLCEN_2v5371 [Hermanssonia centrifuga]